MSSKKELRIFLNDLSKEELIKEVEKLYSKFPQVKTFYDVDLSGDASALMEVAKSKIKNEYFPARGNPKARSGEVKKIIDEFAKISVHPKDIIELYLFRFHMAIMFTNEWGDIDEPFYDAAYNAFAKALKLIEKHDHQSEYKIKCWDIVNSLKPIGWGFSDGVNELYYRYFND
ncbi:MAG: DUF6155 family protein [Segetibacter sp.]